MIDANLANFETEVVETSKTMPVLVDLWAPWCGPCRSLGPVLEKLETSYDGRFKLVKVNTEEEQELAQAFGVRSIPMVVLMKDGQPVDGFVGALPEGQIREFLDKHVPASTDQDDAHEATDAMADAAPVSGLEQLQQALATNPANDAARGEYVKLLLQEGRLDDARRAFEPLAGKVALDRLASALKHWLDAIDAAAAAADIATLQAAIATNKRDFAARFALAQHHMAGQRWTEAMDELLDILMRDKSWNEDAARKAYVAILELIAPPVVKPAEGQAPATDPTVESYRRRLSMVVLS
ncbi:MAG: thioredoxin [Thiomonas sp.]